MKKTYLSPDIETIISAVQEPLMVSGNDNSGMGDDGGVGANQGTFDEEDDDGFTPVATSLWD